MMKKITPLALFLIAFCAFGQEKNTESLNTDLPNRYIESEKLYSNGDTEKSLGLLLKVEEELLKKKGFDSLIVLTYSLKGLIYSRKKDFKKSDSLLNLSMNFALQNNHKPNYYKISNTLDIAKNKIDQGDFNTCLSILESVSEELEKLDITNKVNLKLKTDYYNNYAISKARLGKLNEALIYFKKNKSVREKLLDTLNIKTIRSYIRANNNYALCSSMLNKKEEALSIYLHSLDYAEKFNLKLLRILLYKNLANDYLILMKYDEAKKYADKVIEESNTNNDLYKAYNTLGLIYLNKKEPKKSEEYLRLAYKNAELSKNQYSIANASSNLSILLIENNKIEEAPFYLKKSGDYFYKSVNKAKINTINELYGRYHLHSGEYQKAITFFLEVEKNISNLKPIEDFHIINKMNLYHAYRKSKNYKSASKWAKEAYDLQIKYDSVKKIENVNELTIKYESQQKENEILKLKNETQAKELLIQQSKTKTNYAIVSIFLVVLGGGLYLRKRKKDQKFKLLEESIKSSEQEKIRIGKDLHDGIASNLRLLAYDFETKDVEISHKLLDSYTEIRNLSHLLNNTTIHGEPFMDRLYEIVPNNKDNQLFEVQIKPPYLELKEPYSTHLFRISQELFTNNLKYAKASKTSIDISLKDNYLQLNYLDNGIGSSDLKKGNGLKSIEDRVTLLKGDLIIDANNGFVVRITIPYKK